MRKLIVGVVLCLSLVAATVCFEALPVQPVQAAGETGYGAEVNPTGNPLGGGSGYNSIIDPAQADFLVKTKSELLNAFSKAVSGQIIYVADDARIDMTGSKNITIPAGVTLASGRGRNGSAGGLIYTNDHKPASSGVFNKFMFVGSNVRITGLRLRGDDSEIRSNAYEYELWIGVSAQGSTDVEIDNCEIYNWSEAGIAIFNRGNGHVHHNYIHHCRRTGFGYGVAAAGGTVLVEANVFDYNRHSIMGTRGYPLSNYEARYNLVLENGNGTLFDMHGGNDVGDASVPAGGTVIIHHNTFRRYWNSAVNIRGIPANEVRVYANWSWADPASYSSSSVFKQSLDKLGYKPYQKMTVYDNWFGTTPPPNAPANNAPVTPATPTGPTSGEPGISYNYWAMTTDPEGDTITYTFDWGDGSTSTTKAYSSGSTSSATHSWAEAGTYLVKVNATDSKGAVSAWSANLVVTIVSPNHAPLTPSAPSGPASGETGVSYIYETATTDPDGDNIRYTFDWGDGSSWTTIPAASGNVTSASHIWLSPGEYVVRVQAKDSQGALSEWSDPITVNIAGVNLPPLDPPVPSGPTSGKTGTSYTYQTATTDPDGDSIRYTFDWGDGSSWTTIPVNSGESASASHIWLSPGDYVVKVQAKDSEGATSAWSPILIVSITGPEPMEIVSPNQPPIRPFLFPGILWGRAGTTYNFAAYAIDPDGDMVHYTFDWGDGGEWTTDPMASGTMAYASHSWGVAGVYAVKVKATDFSGATSEWSSVVKARIKDTAPYPVVLFTAESVTIDFHSIAVKLTWVSSLTRKSLEVVKTKP